VARLLLGLANKNLSRQVAASPAIINDAPGLIVTLDGHLDQTLSIALDGAGRIAGISRQAHRYPIPIDRV